MSRYTFTGRPRFSIILEQIIKNLSYFRPVILPDKRDTDKAGDCVDERLKGSATVSQPPAFLKTLPTGSLRHITDVRPQACIL